MLQYHAFYCIYSMSVTFDVSGLQLSTSISEKACYQGCRVLLRPVIGQRGERGRIATPIS